MTALPLQLPTKKNDDLTSRNGFRFKWGAPEGVQIPPIGDFSPPIAVAKSEFHLSPCAPRAVWAQTGLGEGASVCARTPFPLVGDDVSASRKAPLCKGSSAAGGEGLFGSEFCLPTDPSEHKLSFPPRNGGFINFFFPKKKKLQKEVGERAARPPCRSNCR